MLYNRMYYKFDKREIKGKMRCTYKKKGSNKLYVLYKKKYITLKSFKETFKKGGNGFESAARRTAKRAVNTIRNAAKGMKTIFRPSRRVDTFDSPGIPPQVPSPTYITPRQLRYTVLPIVTEQQLQVQSPLNIGMTDEKDDDIIIVNPDGYPAYGRRLTTHKNAESRIKRKIEAERRVQENEAIERARRYREEEAEYYRLLQEEEARIRANSEESSHSAPFESLRPNVSERRIGSIRLPVLSSRLRINAIMDANAHERLLSNRLLAQTRNEERETVRARVRAENQPPMQ